MRCAPASLAGVVTPLTARRAQDVLEAEEAEENSGRPESDQDLKPFMNRTKVCPAGETLRRQQLSRPPRGARRMGRTRRTTATTER